MVRTVAEDWPGVGRKLPNPSISSGPGCGRRPRTAAAWDGVVVGQGRLGSNRSSRIATLREDGRLAIRAIRWHRRAVHHSTAAQRGGCRGRSPGLPLDRQRSHGALLPAAQPRQSGGGRSPEQRHWGPGQRLLLRIPPLRRPPTARLGTPPAGQSLTVGPPCRDDPSAAQAKRRRRIQRHIKELVVLVAEPDAPPDHNAAAARSRRHPVISRKSSGGARSDQGAPSKMTLASLCGAWRALGLNSFHAGRQLLASPQLNC